MEQQLISFLVGAFGVPVFNLIKKGLKLEGDAALLLVSVLSLVFSAISLALSGGFSGEDLVSNFALIFTSSQVIYGFFSKEK